MALESLDNKIDIRHLTIESVDRPKQVFDVEKEIGRYWQAMKDQVEAFKTDGNFDLALTLLYRLKVLFPERTEELDLGHEFKAVVTAHRGGGPNKPAATWDNILSQDAKLKVLYPEENM